MKLKQRPVWIYITTLINFIFLFKTYTYLVDLKTCPCVETDLKVRLKNSELFIMILSFASTIFMLVNPFKMNMWMIMAYLGVMLAFYSYFIYHVFQFHIALKEPCKCAMHWERYYLYYQAFMGSLTSSVILILFLVIGYLMVSMPEFREALYKRV